MEEVYARGRKCNMIAVIEKWSLVNRGDCWMSAAILVRGKRFYRLASFEEGFRV